ncbi:neuferricin homolog [Galleria mellonella]|uniref:Neuferricin homolog n=1 Tax=Galleria mellonella TaxID=7137 RepID=A0A6J1WQV2_GALME|nr:neuferricin homolog [Galleria mellonella]
MVKIIPLALSKLIIPILLVILCIKYRDRFELFFYNFFKTDVRDSNLYSVEQLALNNGIDGNKIYLSILGFVFDVTSGTKHYGKGGPYHYFAGKDGSRAFVTGDFQDESSNKDHILDLTCNDLFTLLNWKDTLREKYNEVGKLVGRYYDMNGKETEYMKMFYERIEQCKVEKDLAKKEELKFPPCNIEWNADTGTRVWCTKTSGGVKRNWIGVPRLLYTPGEETPRCTCVNLENIDNSVTLFKEYDNCAVTSTSCFVKSK